jgi:hypothetical protein
MLQHGLFGYSTRLARIDKAGNPLVQLTKVFDWDQFREIIENGSEKTTEIKWRCKRLRLCFDV